MTEEFQLDPDELLKAIQKEEQKQLSGKLKIFFGMSAGVGKTYAMLEEAQSRLKEGIDIVVGTINTHGRKETQHLLQGLPIIPEKWVKYKDTVFEEMDLEAILKKKPAIVLVDELAHTNVPGSRHPKRWQDVLELLDAGIDVYTSLNVQHIESRKDLVESFAGIQIRETVPDLLLERASSIALVDISPAELLQRLNEGKVYLGDQSQIAARNFFKEDTLTALREIALRLTAEKVDHDLHSLLSQGKGWRTREKLMVAISPSPYSHQLIRKTRRRAFELDAPWVALYVDVGRSLSDEEQARLSKHLNLAQELGAEVVTTYDTDIAKAIQRIAKQKNVTQLVIGRSAPHAEWNIFHKTVLEKVEEENQQLDLLIIRQERPFRSFQALFAPLTLRTKFNEYAITIGTIIGLGILGFILLPWIGYRSVGFIFLLGILMLSFFVGQGPIFLAALISTLAWNYFFIPPVFNWSIQEFEDISLTLIYFITAATIGLLTTRREKEDELLEMRENKIRHLYEIEKEIVSSQDFAHLRLNLSSRLQAMFRGEFDILIKPQDQQELIFDSQLPFLKEEKEQSVAQLVCQNGKIAGWSTSTLSSAKGLYIPINFNLKTLGVLIYYPERERPLSISEMNFLQTVAQHIGIYLERYLYDVRVLNLTFSSQIEKLQASFLQSISQKFYQPLMDILKGVQGLRAFAVDTKSRQIVQKIEEEGRSLQSLVDNLICFSEIESGYVKFEKSEHNLKDYVNACINEIQSFLEEQPFKISFPDQPVMISFDPRLFKIVLKNLLMNAAIFSEDNQPVEIEGHKEKNVFKLSISYRGEGIPAEELPHLFEKVSLSSSLAKREYQQFSIAKTVMDIHQGTIEAHNREGGGTTFTLTLPFRS